MSNFSRSQPSLACWLLSLCLLLFRPSGSNAEAPPAGRPAKDVSVRITAEATYIDHAPKLDGTLDDQLWQSPKVITDFRQREPNEGEPATEKTEVRILYTRHAVYFGIHIVVAHMYSRSIPLVPKAMASSWRGNETQMKAISNRDGTEY